MRYDVLLVDDDEDEMLVQVEVDLSEPHPTDGEFFSILCDAVSSVGQNPNLIDDFWVIGSDEED